MSRYVYTLNPDSTYRVATLAGRVLGTLARVLDQVDYTAGNCAPNEMVGAVLPVGVINKARKQLERKGGEE